MRTESAPRIHWLGRWVAPQETEERIGAAIAGLGRMNVRERDAVGIVGANSLDWIALAWAVGRIGAVLVPLSPRLGPEEIAWQVERAKVVRLFADAGHLAQVPANAQSMDEAFDCGGPAASPRSSFDPRRPRTILFTSGTTGHPKAAVLTIGNHRAHARASARALGVRPGDRWLLCLPLFHVGGLNIVHRCFKTGTDIILHDAFAPDAVGRAIDGEGVTIVSFVETMLRRVVDARDGRPFPPSLRAIVVGGGPVGDDLIEAHPAVLASYGLTESCSMATLVSPGASRGERHSAGRPLPGVRLRIVDEGSTELPAETEGSIEVRGPVVMKGYLGERTATSAAFHDGWLRTGDIGRLDAAGCLHVVARRDDLIVSGGENIYPAEIEAQLRRHAAVADLVVIGIPDPVWGQRPLALVVARGTPPETGVLERFLEERIARYKIPRILFTDEIPRLPNGKPDRAGIRARYAGGR
jgi:O-succinylbenzoic acid--CoA ligase